MTSTSRRGGGGWRGERRDAPSLPEVLYALRERRLLVLGVALVLAGGALLFGLYRGPVYAAEATVSVETQERLGDAEVAETYMRQIQFAVADEELLPEAMGRSGWQGDEEGFREALNPRPFTTGDGGAGLIVGFSDPDPDRAARAANAYAGLFADGVERLEREQLAGAAPVARVSVEEAAPPPARQTGALPLLYAGAAAATGLLIGGAAAMLLEGRTRGWRSVRDAELTLRAPVLGAIPDYSAAVGGPGGGAHETAGASRRASRAEGDG